MKKEIFGKIVEPDYFFRGKELGGTGASTGVRYLKDLKGIFADEKAFTAMNPETLAYKVSSIEPVAQGTPGGLYMGITYLEPGKVGNEYFMTKGHYHLNQDSAEYYWGLEGEGALILMDMERNVWAERMSPGSLHYIPAGIAHRVANTGETTLVFAASWPSDAGHDYATIAKDGFAKRLVEINGKPKLV